MRLLEHQQQKSATEKTTTATVQQTKIMSAHLDVQANVQYLKQDNAQVAVTESAETSTLIHALIGL